MKAEIICADQKLLLGEKVNRAGAYIAGRCISLGLTLMGQSIPGEDRRRLGACLRQAFRRSDVLFLLADSGEAQKELLRESAGKVLKKEIAPETEVLEEKGKLTAVVTQNIDGLHQAAGSKKVLELHGSVHRNYCQSCGKLFDAEYILKSSGIPTCDECGGSIKPDVVLYEEGLDQQTLEDAVYYISHADMLIIGGTSLAVYPAAGLIDYYRGNKLVLINKSTTPLDNRADLLIQGSIGAVLSEV